MLRFNFETGQNGHVSEQLAISATTAAARPAAVKVGPGAIPTNGHAGLDGTRPDPFNPTTTIRYRVDEPMDLTVSVWDLSGQRIRTLARGSHRPGDFSVTLAAYDLPGSTYFVRLESTEGVQAHRMVLAR